VDRDRVARAWAAIRERAGRENAPVAVRHVCMACAQAVDAVGASVSLARGAEVSEPAFASGVGGDDLAELQFTLGEGPCVDALRGPGPVLVADLASASSERRWPMFAPAATGRGARAVFAFPLRVGTIRTGVLEVYRARPGLLSRDELADALVYADAATLLVLGAGDGIVVDRPHLAGDGFDARRAVVHQAAGMISVQIGVGVEDALVRLRAHAYAEDRRLIEVAQDVVESRLRFSRDGRGNPTGDKSTGKEGEA